MQKGRSTCITPRCKRDRESHNASSDGHVAELFLCWSNHIVALILILFQGAGQTKLNFMLIFLLYRCVGGPLRSGLVTLVSVSGISVPSVDTYCKFSTCNMANGTKRDVNMPLGNPTAGLFFIFDLSRCGGSNAFCGGALCCVPFYSRCRCCRYCIKGGTHYTERNSYRAALHIWGQHRRNATRPPLRLPVQPAFFRFTS